MDRLTFFVVGSGETDRSSGHSGDRSGSTSGLPVESVEREAVEGPLRLCRETSKVLLSWLPPAHHKIMPGK
jgi:hypothetical protein